MSRMSMSGAGKRVRVYIGESDQWQGRPLFLALLETLRSEGCAGATVLRGIAGFGANSRIHTATILRLSEDLPVVVEWVDAEDRVERVLPKIERMVESGLITAEEVEIVQYRHQAVKDIGSRLRVREVMTRGIVSVRPSTPMREAVELLVGKSYRALPVVDAGNRVVGIVTNGDLIERGGLRFRMEMLGAMSRESAARELAAIEEGKTVHDVMTRDVITVSPETTLTEAAHIMVARRLKRLPVVDPSGVLLGMVSRVDLLRTCSESYSRQLDEAPPRSGETIGEVMRTGVPVVDRSASPTEVLDAVISTRLNRALVLDEEGRFVGMISDAELTKRLSPKDRPGVLRMLMTRLPFASLLPEERRELERAMGTTAGQLMATGIPTVSPDTRIGEAVRVMLREQQKVLPVVDSDGRFLGAVDRADLLRIVVGV